MRTVKPQPSDAQLTLGGMESAQATDRLFFAVFPDPGTAARIAALAQALHRKHALRGRPLRPERLHVTLHHLGDYAGLPQNVVTAAKEAGNRVKCSTCDVAFDSVLSFGRRPRNCPVVLSNSAGLPALQSLYRKIGECMAISGLARWVKSEFTPHLTLLYDDRALKAQPVESIGWTVREFVLVHSLLGRTEHRVLERWPLLAAP